MTDHETQRRQQWVQQQSRVVDQPATDLHLRRIRLAARQAVELEKIQAEGKWVCERRIG